MSIQLQGIMNEETDKTLRTVVFKGSCVTVNSESERNLHFRDKSIFKIDCVHSAYRTQLCMESLESCNHYLV